MSSWYYLSMFSLLDCTVVLIHRYKKNRNTNYTNHLRIKEQIRKEESEIKPKYRCAWIVLKAQVCADEIGR